MTLYKEILAMGEAIEHAYQVASEMDRRASKIQLQIESTRQFDDVKRYRKHEEEHRRIAKWLGQLQAIYEIIDSYKNADIEEQDSVGAFLKILDVVEKRCAD